MLEFSRVVTWSGRCAIVAGIAASIGLSCGSARAQGPEVRAEPLKDISHLRWPGCPGYPCKEAKSPPQAGMRKDAIIVKFNADAKVRLRAEGLVDLGTGQIKDPAVQATLAKYAALGCRWAKMHETVSEDKLDQMRDTAMRNLGKMITDMNAEMFLFVPAGVDRATAIDDFNALSIVEMAEEAPDAMALPAAGDYRNNQGYLKIATEGMGAYSVRLLPGGNGSAVRIADCEYSWNLAHTDLPAVTSLVANASDPFADNNHGTAVLGEMGSRRDGIGTEGGAYGATFYVAAANTTTLGYNLANAITAASAALSGGDVILIEQQTTGPNYTGVPAGTQFGLVPSEWQQSVYNAIVTAIGNGRYVVSAAGNGSQNLDDAAYSTGHGGFYPFLAANDSGDIIVGAASPPVGGSSTDRSRLGFSCYGATVDMQGYGEGVYTTGYGDLYNATVNERYTAGFSGTSSASPTVVNAVALFSSLYETRFATFPSPGYGRTQLRNFGAAQQSGANPSSQNIGPRPNTLAAWNGILGTGFPPANNACASAVNTSNQGTYIGYTCAASNDGTGTCGGSNTSPDVWYSFTAPASVGGTLVVTSCGTHDYGFTDQGIDTVVSLFTGCGGTELTCNDDSTGPYACTGVLGNNRDSSVSTTIVAGQTILIRVANFSTSVSGPFQINVSMIPNNDSCASAIDVSTGGTYFATTAGSTNDGTASCGGAATNNDVWFTYTACDNGTLHVDTCGTHDAPGVDLGMDTVMALFSACGGSQIGCNDDAPGAGLSCGASDASVFRDSKLDLAMVAGQNIKIRVSKFGAGAEGNFRINVAFNAAHDTCGTAKLLALQTSTPFDTNCMTSDGNTESGCITPAYDTWFYFFAPSSGPMRIETCGSSYDTAVIIYDNFCPSGNNNASMVTCNDDACGLQSIVSFQAIAGHDYGVRVGGFGAGRGSGVVFAFCPADFNRDHAINVQDIFDFLAAWFAGNPAANTNGLGGINVQDIFDFLALWFAGC